MGERETDAERDQRVRKAQDDRAKRDEQAPLTGALSLHDVVRHLINHGPARNDAERDELLGQVDKDDPTVKTQVKPEEKKA